MTAGLLASATFLVVAVESFHREPEKDFLDPHSGSGGFALLGESDLPLYQDLNDPSGRAELNFPDNAGEILHGVHEGRPADVQRSGISQCEWFAGEEYCYRSKVIFVERSEIIGKKADLFQL